MLSVYEPPVCAPTSFQKLLQHDCKGDWSVLLSRSGLSINCRSGFIRHLAAQLLLAVRFVKCNACTHEFPKRRMVGRMKFDPQPQFKGPQHNTHFNSSNLGKTPMSPQVLRRWTLGTLQVRVLQRSRCPEKASAAIWLTSGMFDGGELLSTSAPQGFVNLLVQHYPKIPKA